MKTFVKRIKTNLICTSALAGLVLFSYSHAQPRLRFTSKKGQVRNHVEETLHSNGNFPTVA